MVSSTGEVIISPSGIFKRPSAISQVRPLSEKLKSVSLPVIRVRFPLLSTLFGLPGQRLAGAAGISGVALSAVLKILPLLSVVRIIYRLGYPRRYPGYIRRAASLIGSVLRKGTAPGDGYRLF